MHQCDLSRHFWLRNALHRHQNITGVWAGASRGEILRSTDPYGPYGRSWRCLLPLYENHFEFAKVNYRRFVTFSYPCSKAYLTSSPDSVLSFEWLSVALHLLLLLLLDQHSLHHRQRKKITCPFLTEISHKHIFMHRTVANTRITHGSLYYNWHPLPLQQQQQQHESFPIKSLCVMSSAPLSDRELFGRLFATSSKYNISFLLIRCQFISQHTHWSPTTRVTCTSSHFLFWG